MAGRSGLSRWRRQLVAWALGTKAANIPQTISLSLLDPKGWDLFSSTSNSGKRVDDESAMRVSTVWACNKILSEAIGMLPLAMYEKDAHGNPIKINDHPTAMILTDRPNADMTDLEFREAAQLNLGLRGNAYSFKQIDGRGKLVSLYPIPSNRVEPIRSDDGTISYKINDRNKWEVYPQEKIWHLKSFSLNGLAGLSVISSARETMGVALATEDFQARFFSNGARPSAIATYPGHLKPEQRPIARENINQLLGGLDNAHRIHILEGGMKLEPWGMPLEDAQFLELRQFSISDICRFYLIPPHMVADLSRATFSNIEHQSLQFVHGTLKPWLRLWERSARHWLLSTSERQRYFFRFDYDEILSIDATSRQQLISGFVQNGILSRNEARAKENLGRVNQPGMDDYTVQVNLTPVDDLPGAGEIRPRKQEAVDADPEAEK